MPEITIHVSYFRGPDSGNGFKTLQLPETATISDLCALLGSSDVTECPADPTQRTQLRLANDFYLLNPGATYMVSCGSRTVRFLESLPQ